MQYDFDIQRLFGLMTDINRIDCLNYIFDDNIPYDTNVEWLNRKSAEENLLETDFVLKVGNTLYHMEIESRYSDKEIGIRMWKYGLRVTGQHDDRRDVELHIPQQVVIYLRTPKNAWHTLKTKVILPDGQTVTYDVPCRYVSEMRIPEMIEQAIMFAPALLLDLIGKRGGSKKAAQSFMLIKTIADELLTKKIIKTKLYKQIMETTAAYTEEVILKDILVEDKERTWTEVLAQVGYIEPIRRIEMRAEERVTKIAYHLIKGKSPEQIATEMGVTKEQVLAIAKKITAD